MSLGYSNPADKGMDYLNKIPDTIKPYYDPYINAGKNSLSSLMGQYSSLLNNPNAIMKMLGKGYQQSPGYQFDYNQGMNATNAAAASGGMLGTPYHQQNAASMASNLADQDYQKYMQQMMQLYGFGLQGEQGINEMGFNASTGLADQLANNQTNQAGMAYAGQSNKNQANADLWNSAIKGGTAGLTYF